jgi:hypothetical protein
MKIGPKTGFVLLTVFGAFINGAIIYVGLSLAGSAIKAGLGDCDSVYLISDYLHLQMFCPEE